MSNSQMPMNQVNHPDPQRLAALIEDKLKGGLERHFLRPEYQERKTLALRVFALVYSPAAPLIGVVLGLQGSIRPGYPDMLSLNFIQKAFGVSDVRQLPSDQQERVRAVVSDIFGCGILMQHLFFNFPTRGRLADVDLRSHVEGWAVNALVANQQMKAWDKEAQNLPLIFVRSHFQEDLEPLLKSEWRIGFWRRGQASSLLENIFFAGAQWAIQCDLATVEGDVA